MLSDVRSFRIRGEYRTWDDRGWLDNVALGAEPLAGDANRDGMVDFADAATLLRMAGGLLSVTHLAITDTWPSAGDGKVGIQDALNVFNLME